MSVIRRALPATVLLGLTTSLAQVQLAPTLTRVSDLRHMTAAEAGRCVRIEGIVTVLAKKNSFFLQDGNLGILVDRVPVAGARAVYVYPGDEVVVTGVSGPGLFAPLILAGKIQVLGQKR